MINKVIVVIFENTAYESIIGNTKEAPYFNMIAAEGALMTHSYGMTHPSQPNYMYLFTGDSCGVDSNDCRDLDAPNLYTKGVNVVGYSEDLPARGSRVHRHKHYARKHSPWASFINVPDVCNLPFSDFPTNFALLPDVSFVIPNLMNDIHDGSIEQGDKWLRDNLGNLFEWVKDNNSVIIVTFDEDDKAHDNHIYTVLYGANIFPGEYDQHIDHVNVYDTILAAKGFEADEPIQLQFKCVKCGKRATVVEMDERARTYCGKECRERA